MPLHVGGALERARAYFLTPLQAGLVSEHRRWLTPKRQRDRARDHRVRFPGMDQADDSVSLRLVEIRPEDGTWWGYGTSLIEGGLTPADRQAF